MPSAVQSLRARWVFPVAQPPLRDGVVEIVDDKIIAVRPYRLGDEVNDLGDVALLPGLVNAHTHLEFSDLQQPLGQPLMPFPDWIRLVIEYRKARADIDRHDPYGIAGSVDAMDAIDRGLTESDAAGVALLGEIATYILSGVSGSLRTFASNAGGWPKQVVFQELLGLSPERDKALWQAALDHLNGPADRDYIAGISPHATYTAHPDLLARICSLSSKRGFPVAMHVAESLEEIELLQSGSGRLVELLDSLNAFPRNVIPRGTRPLSYLQLLSQASKALVIHGNYLAGDEIAFLGERSERMSVVYCPRTHAYFNAGDYPLAELLAANVNVCLGTDSRASNPDLNLFEEMRFVATHHPTVTPEGVLYLGTQAGADALGLGERFGSISPGKSTRMTKVQLVSTSATDPHALLFETGTRANPL
jgi:cytosine/adenosine deaminase-related metal-dependent hydrolase